MKLITNLAAVAAIATLVVPAFAQTAPMSKPMMHKPMAKKTMMHKPMAKKMMMKKGAMAKPMAHSTMKPMMKKPM